jgi:uncharacterized protein (DUF924 family)
MLTARAEAIRRFWFGGPGDADCGRFRKIWFQKDEAFDREIAGRFGPDMHAALAGGYGEMAREPAGTVALLLLLDQFPRNVFRGQARAFAGDTRARSIADAAIASGVDTRLPGLERLFVYLPFEHSEDLADQQRCVALMRALPLDGGIDASLREVLVDFAERHRVIVERFGRFPHRNQALGRTSTPAELEFLTTSGSSF